MNFKTILFCFLALAVLGCGTPDDPSKSAPIGDPPSEPRTDPSYEEETGDVIIRNLNVRVFNDASWAGCRAVTTPGGACPVYEITFSLRNRSTSKSVDRVRGATLNLNDGFPEIDLNFTCDKVPWFIEPESSSNVIDLAFSYGGDERSDPYVSFSCGQAMDSPDSFERPEFEFDGLELGPQGPTTGTAELRLDGLMGDASTWRARAETRLE